MDNLSFSQKQRLYFIDFRLMFVGHFTRAEVVEHFKSGLSSATRDINIYKELAEQNLTYSNAEKKYFITDAFKPIFKHNKQKSFAELVTQLSGDGKETDAIKFPFAAPSQLVSPNISIVATLTQAAINAKPVEIGYISLSNGKNSRIVVPHSIVDNGLRWHIRAYDCETNQFRDFVISRITAAKIINMPVQDKQKMLADQQWMRIVPLELVPHPTNIKYPQAIELDYGMDKGVLILESRAALIGYILRRWNVDCSDDATQNTAEHQLWLRNRPTLYGVENLHLASGYDYPTPSVNALTPKE